MERSGWDIGTSTAYPKDGRVFIERGRSGQWRVYQTDADGGILWDLETGDPLLMTEQTFDSAALAISWVEQYVPAYLPVATNQ